MTPGIPRADDAERLRQFKAEFFKALARPLRIRILELLRGRNIVTTERRRTTIIYEAGEGEMGVPQRSPAGHHRRRTEG